jgi:hypothetical protein
MTRAVQEQWHLSSVNLDTVCPQCVGWRYAHGQANHLGQVLHQVDGRVTPDSLSPPLHDVQGADGGLDASLEWDDYVSDPSFVTRSTHANYRSFDVDTLVSLLMPRVVMSLSYREDGENLHHHNHQEH